MPIANDERIKIHTGEEFRARTPEENSWLPFAEAVLEAVEEVRIQVAPLPLQVDPDGNGGVFVVIDGIDPGLAYIQDRSGMPT